MVNMLRNGVKRRQHEIALYYAAPTPGKTVAEERYRQNRFSVSRQLRFSARNRREFIDLVLFVNSLPVLTFELKNSLTKQTAADDVQQFPFISDARANEHTRAARSHGRAHRSARTAYADDGSRSCSGNCDAIRGRPVRRRMQLGAHAAADERNGGQPVANGSSDRYSRRRQVAQKAYIL